MGCAASQPAGGRPRKLWLKDRASFERVVDSGRRSARRDVRVLRVGGDRAGSSFFHEFEAKQLATALRQRAFPLLGVLNLEGSPILDEGCRAVAEALAGGAGRQLLSLNMSACRVTHVGGAALARALQGGELPLLRSLYLSGNALGDEGCEALGEAFAAMGTPQLRVLALAEAAVGPDGVLALASAVDEGGLPQLRELNLSDNACGDRGAEALAGVAGYLGELEVLNLASTGLCNLPQPLSALPRLRLLNVDYGNVMLRPPSHVCEQGIAAVREWFGVPAPAPSPARKPKPRRKSGGAPPMVVLSGGKGRAQVRPSGPG